MRDDENIPIPRRKSSDAAGIPKIDRLPPHSLEAEQGVLGCVLLSPTDCLGECIEKLKPGAVVFYDLRHQTLFEVLVAMYDEKIAIDIITLQTRLKDKNNIAGAGGLGYISSLSDAVPSAANLQYYLDIVLEKFLLRKTVQTCTEVVGRVYDYEGEVDALLDEVERDILAISQHRASTATPNMKELVARSINTIEMCHAEQGSLSGVSTGFSDFDKMTTGLHEGEMIVIAARPSVGKTSLAMNIAEHAAIEQKIPVAVFSLEMTAEALVMRMLCSLASVNVRNVRDGFLSERDFLRLTAAAGKLTNCPLHIDDTGGLTILQLRAKARRLWQQHGIKLIIVDYLQLLHSPSRRNDNRQQEIAEISGGIKALAKELKVPVIVLSQLNRELEKRGPGERPRMSDLRESGAIEQDADLIGLLFREIKEGEDEVSTADTLSVKLFIAKQRNGPTGDVDLTFFKQYTRFETANKIEAEYGS